MSDIINNLKQSAYTISKETVILSDFVLDDPRFPIWSGSHGPDKHHYGRGGLAQHTYEVSSLCFASVTCLQTKSPHEINTKILFLAALWHDMGKMWDYNVFAPSLGYGRETNDVILIESSYLRGEQVIWQAAQPHKRRINHLCRSAVEWSKAVDKTGLCKDIHDDVLHCILAHHGNFGSPVLPATREAWILHTCDQMSARYDDCDRLDLSKK